MKSILVPILGAAIVAAAVSIFVLRSGYGGPTALNTVTDTEPDATRAGALRTLLAAYKKNPDSTTILLFKDGVCRAEVGSDPVGNRPERRVFWHVLNDDVRPCELKAGETHPKIRLVFTPNEKEQFPFQSKEANSRRHGDLTYVYEKIKKHGSDKTNEVEYGLYKYSVYLLNGTNDPKTPVLDPDLEVEDGNVLMGPKPAGTPNPPPPPPQKKP